MLLNRRDLLQLAAMTIACGLTAGSIAAQQATTATVTLTIEGMT